MNGVEKRTRKGPRDAERKPCPYKTPSPGRSGQRINGLIVDQLYDDVPTLKSTSVCLNSLRVRVLIWCIWCGLFTPHSPPQAADLFNTKGLPSGLDRTRGVVEHFRAPVQEEQPQRTPADGGPPGGRPLTSKPRRRRVSHLSQTGYKQWTGLGVVIKRLLRAPTRMNVEQHTGVQCFNQTKVEPQPACIYLSI